jgi:hypothetical protein
VESPSSISSQPPPQRVRRKRSISCGIPWRDSDRRWRSERPRNRLQTDFHLAPAHRKIVKNEFENGTIQIMVKKAHLRHMLQRYLDGEVSEFELSNWAALIYVLPFFIPEGETEDEQ